MRVIQLPEDRQEARDFFAVYRTAAFGGSAPDEPDLYALAGLQDALEAVSHEEEAEVQGKQLTFRALDDGVSALRLEDAHWKLLQKRILGAGLQWLPANVRTVLAAKAAVDGALEEKPGERKLAVAGGG